MNAIMPDLITSTRNVIEKKSGPKFLFGEHNTV